MVVERCALGLTVLFTNHTLDTRAGSELYVRDVALGLRRRGHSVIAYSRKLGAVADELRMATVAIVDDLAQIATPPDVIHGHHHLETMTAALHFPHVPVVSFCHGWMPWEEVPAKLPTVGRWVAVDRTVYDRLRFEEGIPERAIKLLYNFVDLQRFAVGPPLPPQPRRALLLNNSASDRTHLPHVLEACRRRGIELDVGGFATRVIDRPEEVLPRYDLVFAKARAAMEAMATGRAVVLCDFTGAGPLVRSEDFARLRELNFGIRTMQRPIGADAIGAEIDRYDAADAALVRDEMRRHGDLESRLDELVALYREVIAEATEPPTAEAVGRAASAYLRFVSGRIKLSHSRTRTLIEEKAALEQQVAELAEKEKRASDLVSQLIALNELMKKKGS